jgi:hypothetical protein
MKEQRLATSLSFGDLLGAALKVIKRQANN